MYESCVALYIISSDPRWVFWDLRERPPTARHIFRLWHKLEVCRPVPAGPGPPPHPRWHLWVPWGSGGGFFTNPATPPHPAPPFVAKALVPEHGNELNVAVWGCLWARRPAPKPPIALPGPPGVAEGAGVGWAADLWPPWHPAGCFTAWRWGPRRRFAGVCLL